MSNEELAVLVQSGDRSQLLPLWRQVRGLVWAQVHRWQGVGRLESEDFMQVGFMALLRAVETYDSTKGAAFSTWFLLCIRAEFTEATGQNTERQRRDPLQSAASLDVPLGDDGDGETLADILPDPEAERAIEAVAEDDRIERLHDAIMEALADLPEAQQEAICRKYWLGAPVDRKVHNAALRTLRNPKVSRRLIAYW